jgi:S1-C subfamily serine protease
MVLLGISTLVQQGETLSPPPPSIASQQWRVLRLARKREDGFHFVGTGFVVTRSDRTYIVTCAHRADNPADSAPLYADFLYPLNAHPTALVAKNSEADPALLAVDVAISGATQQTTIDVREGMEVFVVGFDDQHTEKDNPQIQSGVITTVGWWEDRGHRLFTSRRTTLSGPLALLISGSNCQPGKSGSSVFEADGKILAVTTSFTHNHSCLATAMPALVDLLEQMEPFE